MFLLKKFFFFKVSAKTFPSLELNQTRYQRFTRDARVFIKYIYKDGYMSVFEYDTYGSLPCSLFFLSLPLRSEPVVSLIPQAIDLFPVPIAGAINCIP